MAATALRQRTIARESAVPKLSLLLRADTGRPMEETFALAKERGVELASLKGIGEGLKNLDTYHRVKMACVCRSGTVVAYVEPGRTFGEAGEKAPEYGKGYFVVYIDRATNHRYLFPIPEEHLDKMDAVLVAECPRYSLEFRGNDRVVRPARAGLVEGLPATSWWYAADPVHGIASVFEPVTPLSEMLFLVWEKIPEGQNQRSGKMVTMAASDHGKHPNPERRRVILDKPPSERLGAIAEEF